MVGRISRGRLAVLAVVVLSAMGSAGCDEHAMVLSPDHLDRGLVIVLPGIDGVALHNLGLAEALRDAPVPAGVEIWIWTSPLGPLFNQTAMEHNRSMAAELAVRIGRYRSEHPDGSVVLIGHSGGTAIAVWAAESLAASAGQIDGIIMLGSSLSPGYDLSPALLRIRRGIVNVYSSSDGGLLGVGTAMVGTMDRLSSAGAGKVGFRGAPGRVYQVAWDSSMARYDYHGDHFSCCAKRFATAYLAPLVAAEDWDQQLLNSLGQDEAMRVASVSKRGGQTFQREFFRMPISERILSLALGMGNSARAVSGIHRTAAHPRARARPRRCVHRNACSVTEKWL